MKNYTRKGFTLVELLIVIAILGTLAVVVLLALNPLQQLARTRDAGRTSGVTQIGHALEAYATTNNGVYPTTGGSDFITQMVTTGELQSVPSPVQYTLANTLFVCSNDAEGGLCYALSGNDAVVYTAAEADANIHRCDAAVGGSAAFGDAWFVYSTTAGRGGIVCGAEPGPGVVAADFVN